MVTVGSFSATPLSVKYDSYGNNYPLHSFLAIAANIFSYLAYCSLN